MNIKNKIAKVDALYKQGKREQALETAKKLYKKNKDNVHVIFCYGSMLYRHKIYEQALPLLKKVYTLRPDDPSVLHNLAYTLFYCGIDDEAESIFSKLILTETENAKTWLLLAQLLYRRGNLVDAIDTYKKVVTIAPSSFKAHYEIVKLTKVAINSPSYEFFLNLTKSATLFHQVVARFMLGKIYLDHGEVDQSFLHYKLGNELIIKIESEKKIEEKSLYKTSARDRLILNKNRFNPESLTNARKHSKSKIVIICGTPRSGKSLCESLLADHPKISVQGESELLTDTLQDILSGTNPSDRTNRDIIDKFATTIEKKIRLNDNQIAVFTNPGHTWSLGYLSLAFPSAPIVFCHRNPLDLGIAIYFKQFKENFRHPYNTDLKEIGKEIRITEVMMQYWKKILPNPTLLLGYSELVSNPVTTAQKLCDHIGVEFHEEYLTGLYQEPSIAMALGPAGSIYTTKLIPIISDYEGIGSRFEKYLGPLKDGYKNAI